MLVDFYKIVFTVCMQTLVPNSQLVLTLLPVHQQAYIFQGAERACLKETEFERQMACTEDPKLCQ